MGEQWKPQSTPERFPWNATLQYLRGPGTEGAHDVAFPAGRVLRVLPDGRTTTKMRAVVIRRALEAELGLDGVVGGLVLAGATNLELDGTVLVPFGRWMVELRDNGEMSARYVKGS